MNFTQKSNKRNRQLLSDQKEQLSLFNRKCIKNAIKWNSRIVEYLQSNKVNKLFESLMALMFVVCSRLGCFQFWVLTQTDRLIVFKTYCRPCSRYFQGFFVAYGKMTVVFFDSLDLFDFLNSSGNSKVMLFVGA